MYNGSDKVTQSEVICYWTITIDYFWKLDKSLVLHPRHDKVIMMTMYQFWENARSITDTRTDNSNASIRYNGSTGDGGDILLDSQTWLLLYKELRLKEMHVKIHWW